ncbi:hypothetical protein BH18VER1_BH18VER1_10340 [soil metagenome]
MAKEGRQEQSIAELRQQVAHSRDRLERDLTGLKYEIDFPLKFRKSFQRHAGIWISAAVLTGVMFVARGTKKKEKVVYRSYFGKSDQQKKGEEQKKGLLAAGLAMGALRFAATLLRPMVISMITKKMGSYAGASATSRKW